MQAGWSYPVSLYGHYFGNEMKNRIYEPFWWSLFGAGGAISALVLPIFVVIFGLAIPLSWIEPPSFTAMSSLLHNWVIRLIIVIIITLSMLHWAHRFRFTLDEGLQLHKYDRVIAFICYFSAIGVGLISGYIFLINW